MDAEDTRCFLAILDFLLTQASKHDVAESLFNRDITQMGVAIDNANTITKVYSDNQDALVKA